MKPSRNHCENLQDGDSATRRTSRASCRRHPKSELEYDLLGNSRHGINDEQRVDIALKGVAGKRLAYQTTTRPRKPKAPYQLELPLVGDEMAFSEDERRPILEVLTVGTISATNGILSVPLRVNVHGTAAPEGDVVLILQDGLGRELLSKLTARVLQAERQAQGKA